ncbi:conserved domain protein [Trichinella spiralis]|uniref:hypothetical protein n=1 Tax=Trichinella spiralis TaxID=6334 RepID=UPI0001EFC1D7|nr:conserved domain protein [Trichinella spiralis]
MSICVSCCGFCSVSLEILQGHHVTDFVELEMLSQLRRPDCCWYEIMTIPTKVEDQSKKAPLESTDGTFNAEMPPSANLNHPISGEPLHGLGVEARILYLVCLTSLILWLLLTTILGTLLLYRYMERQGLVSLPTIPSSDNLLISASYFTTNIFLTISYYCDTMPAVQCHFRSLF